MCEKHNENRILIIGPVETNSYFGGVATFDEGLAKGLENNGCISLIATDQIDAITERSDIGVVRINWKTIQNVVDIFHPKYIITELGYAKYLFKLKTDAKKIYYLHAFFKQVYYGRIKSYLAVLYQKALISYCDLVISNSHFTSMINRDFYNIESNAVCEVGLKDEFFDNVKQNSNLCRINNSVLFAARLVNVKGADKVVEAIKRLNTMNNHFQLYIAGDGPERSYLEELSKDINPEVVFLGKLNQEEIVKRYLQSDIFISLDQSEPYGIVFLEALVSGCKIVCPKTGGQIEILKDFQDSTAYVDRYDVDDIARGILESSNRNRPIIDEYKIKEFGYNIRAKKLLNILNNML